MRDVEVRLPRKKAWFRFLGTPWFPVLIALATSLYVGWLAHDFGLAIVTMVFMVIIIAATVLSMLIAKAIVIADEALANQRPEQEPQTWDGDNG